MNYCEHHLGDYAKRTTAFSMLEHGAYAKLRDRYFVTEAAIPAVDVYRQAGARSKEERAAVDVVLAEFYSRDGDVWRCRGFDEDIAKAQAKIKAAKENGKLGGRPKQTENKPTGFPLGSDSVTQDKALQTPDTITSSPSVQKKARKRADTTCPDDVAESVWNDWVGLRKGHKADASATAVEAARDEAGKAGMTLEAFLRVWCLRGSRGLQADWLKPHERQQSSPKSFREQSEEFAKAQFAGWAGSALKSHVIETEADDAPRLTLG